MFRITNDQTDQVILKQLPVAFSNSRYDLFSVLEGTDVSFPVQGDYRYEVFQMPDGTSLDPSEGKLVETGKIEFEEPESDLLAPDIDTETIAYEPAS